MSTPYKLQTKIGSAEFSAEGSEETVKEQFQQFLAALAALSPGGAGSKPPPAADQKVHEFQGGNGNGGGNGPTLSQAVLDEAFIVDGSGGVSLRSMPSTDNRAPDTLLLLLYGFRVLRGQQDVNAGTLAEAARTSGLQLDRIDRFIGVHESLIRRGGFKRGVRYSLNNQGIIRAESILAEMYA